MKGTHIKRLSALLLLLAMLVSLAACGKEETPIEKTARYLQAQIPEPTCAAVGGDWLVFGLARSGLKVPQKYFDTYYKNVEDYIVSVDGGANGSSCASTWQISSAGTLPPGTRTLFKNAASLCIRRARTAARRFALSACSCA